MVFKGVIGICLLALVGCSVIQPSTDQFSVEIAHTNDIHAQVDSFNKYFQPCSPEDKITNKCFGGLSRVITAAKRLKEQNPDLVFLDAGDLAQGSFYFRIYKEELVSWFANQISYDALTLGNHDFDEGSSYVVKSLTAIKTPYVSANIDSSANAEVNPLIKPYVIIKRNGQRIGIIGAITEEAISLMPNMNGLTIAKINSSSS